MEFIIGNAGVHVPEDNNPDHGGGPIRRSVGVTTRSGDGMPPYGYPQMVQRTPHQVVPDAEPGQGYWPGRVGRMKYLPDGRMVRGGGMGGGLGAEVVAGQTTIETLQRGLNAMGCLTSRQWLPIIRQAMEFASDNTAVPTAWLKWVPGPHLLLRPSIGAYAQLRADMKKRWFTLDYWRNRLASEPEAKYCGGVKIVGTTQYRSADYDLIRAAIIGPYIEVSGQIAAKAVINEAIFDLAKTIASLGFWNPDKKGGAGFEWPFWLKVVAGVGAAVVVGAVIIKIVPRRSVIVHRQEIAPPPMSGDFGRLARALAKHAAIHQLGRYMP